MTDVSEGSGPIPRRSPRASDGAPVSGALAIVLAVVAVVAGFLILRSISGDDPQGLGVPSGGDGATTGSVPDPSGTTLPTVTAAPITGPPTSPAIVTTGATVVVANASSISGTAAQMSTALQTVGFTMGDPTNAAGLVDPLTASVVYYDPAQAGAQPVANSVAQALGGGVSVLPLEGTPPVQDGNLNGAGVLLMLGTDKAGRTLDELNPTAAPPAPTQITNPPVGATTPATSLG